MQTKSRNLFHAVILLLVVVFTHQFLPVCVLAGFYGPRGCELGLAPVQVIVLLGMIFLLLRRILLDKEVPAYIGLWKKNWLVSTFILLALLSSLWSVRVSMTALRSFLMLELAMIAAYYGLRTDARDLLNFIAIAVGALGLLSLLLGVFLPDLAIMANHPYEGLWRGVYWHKVYLGASMALGYIGFLFLLFSPRHTIQSPARIVAGVLLVLCLALALLSDSASGQVVIAFQTGLFALFLLWFKWGHLMNRRSYLLLAAVLLGLILLIFFNLDLVFGLFNRSASMTGRIPLWEHLIKSYIAQRPLFGYGVGTFWYQPGVSVDVQTVVGWGYPVGVSDNGYMDLLLGLGASGLVLFLAILLTALGRTLLSGYRKRTFISFFPFFVIVHVMLVNMSLSYFVESESFIWFLVMLVTFMSTKESREFHT